MGVNFLLGSIFVGVHFLWRSIFYGGPFSMGVHFLWESIFYWGPFSVWIHFLWGSIFYLTAKRGRTMYNNIGTDENKSEIRESDWKVWTPSPSPDMETERCTGMKMFTRSSPPIPRALAASAALWLQHPVEYYYLPRCLWTGTVLIYGCHIHDAKPPRYWSIFREPTQCRPSSPRQVHVSCFVTRLMDQREKKHIGWLSDNASHHKWLVTTGRFTVHSLRTRWQHMLQWHHAQDRSLMCQDFFVIF